MQNTFRTCRRTAQTEYANGGTGSAISDALIERLPDREELGNARPAPHSRRLRQRWDTEFSKHSNRTSNQEPRGKATASNKSLASAATATHTSGAHSGAELDLLLSHNGRPTGSRIQIHGPPRNHEINASRPAGSDAGSPVCRPSRRTHVCTGYCHHCSHTAAAHRHPAGNELKLKAEPAVLGLETQSFSRLSVNLRVHPWHRKHQWNPASQCSHPRTPVCGSPNRNPTTVH